MLCCIGLIGGSVVGQALGGPWTIIGPAAGFGIGLVADMKVMKGMHRNANAPQADQGAKAGAESPASGQNPAAAPAAEGGACCGIGTGLKRILGPKVGSEEERTSPVESGKSPPVCPGEPATRG